MKYFVDCEFDGHNGPLLSLAIVAQDGLSCHWRTGVRAMDIWVIQNVEPLMDSHKASFNVLLSGPNSLGGELRDFLAGDDAPVIIADSPVDIERFCRAYMTDRNGDYFPNDRPKMRFEVHDVDAYPTTLEGAVQHNAWWDAMALRNVLTTTASASGYEAKRSEPEAVSGEGGR